MSTTMFSLVVVKEVTLSRYESQLEFYKNAERALKAIYMIIDVVGMGEKAKKILELKNIRMAKEGIASDVIFVDGTRKLSASKRKSQ